mmetsp:Transcript_69618/g.196352  ORF Transcript_69618/g.196352 Transcript_69618/m.196352 type:complete len:123 (-) Transcript_69618:187-555(-)
MASQSQELIQQLLQAERKAEDIIASAKQARLKKLRQAKEKAEEELAVFRKDQDAKFQAELGSKSLGDPHKALEKSTQMELSRVQSDYSTNKAATVDYVCGKVLDVRIDLSQTQMQALKQAIA